MKSSEVAKRYAKALYELSVENKSTDAVFSQLRTLSETFAKEPSIHAFLVSPLVNAGERTKVLHAALDNKGITSEVVDTLMLLGKNNRFGLFSELVTAFETEADHAHGINRGSVRSATVLAPEERQRLEKTIEGVLNKKVILTYKVDPAVIGGLIASVGSFTFDDSIDSHLKRMNEELKRRTV